MTFHQIAYGPDEHVLVTFDGGDLLAHDAQTEAPKWSLSFVSPLVAVFFADSGALPGADGASPWRNAAVARCVVAVDSDGAVHVVDPMQGREMTKLGPYGKPVAVAEGAGGRVALATEDRLYLWRSGELTEIPARASALAFSSDGTTLAIGERDGSLRFLSVAGTAAPAETFCAVVHGGVSDVVQHPSGTWIVAGKSGVTTVSDAGPQRLEGVPAGVVRIRLDPGGKRLAAQLSERVITVYAWPSLQVELRVEYVERPVRGLAFGPGNWLGVALDHGDGNKIDIVTSSAHRTDTHPGSNASQLAPQHSRQGVRPLGEGGRRDPPDEGAFPHAAGAEGRGGREGRHRRGPLGGRASYSDSACSEHARRRRLPPTTRARSTPTSIRGSGASGASGRPARSAIAHAPRLGSSCSRSCAGLARRAPRT